MTEISPPTPQGDQLSQNQGSGLTGTTGLPTAEPSTQLHAAKVENNASPIGAILAGAEEFLTGAKVEVKINAGSGLEFTAKNPFGTEYQFKATGQFELVGNPQ